jgi:large subunit ribosomal protein L4
MKLALRNRSGETIGDLEVSDAVFGAEINEALLHQAVTTYLANQRQGTASTKNRSAVRGGGRKPWRQKGTGRARQGSIRSPLWRKGGVVFGPQPREYRLSLPRKMRAAALRSALSAKARDQELVVVDDLGVDRPHTRTMRACLEALESPRALVVTAVVDPNVHLSVRNLPGSDAVPARDLSAYPVLAHRSLVLTRDAVRVLEEVLG